MVNRWMNGRKRKAIATLYVVRDVDSIPAFLPLVFQSLYGLVLEYITVNE